VLLYLTVQDLYSLYLLLLLTLLPQQYRLYHDLFVCQVLSLFFFIFFDKENTATVKGQQKDGPVFFCLSK